MKTFTGKQEMINGQWHSVTVNADNIKEANKMLLVGQRKSYGIVEKIRGRFTISQF
jgi:hypothetical protein